MARGNEFAGMLPASTLAQWSAHTCTSVPLSPSPPLLQAALERGLVLDDFTIQQLIDEKDSFVARQTGAVCFNEIAA